MCEIICIKDLGHAYIPRYVCRYVCSHSPVETRQYLIKRNMYACTYCSYVVEST